MTKVSHPWRSVAIPSEHGGWSLTAEPALLGLLVAWSWPGFSLGLAALIAFVARTPLKLVLIDLWRHRWLDRTRTAAIIAAVEIVLFVALVVYAASTTQNRFWVPLAIAAPLVAIELWFDMRSRSRRLVPELAGAIGIGSIATAIGLADGLTGRVAWGLWLIIAARAGAAIPYVRAQILRGHDRPVSLWSSDFAQVLAAVATIVGWFAGWVPVAAAVAITLVAAFNIATIRFAPRPAVVIGVQQTLVGIAVIVTTAIAS